MLAKNRLQTFYRRFLLPFACLGVIAISSACSESSRTESDRATQNTNAQSNDMEFLGYDGDLDDWPVNETNVEAVINSSDALTEEYIEGLQTTQKGFHTLELLLFGEDNNKTAADFDRRDLDLLKALTSAFKQSATQYFLFKD